MGYVFLKDQALAFIGFISIVFKTVKILIRFRIQELTPAIPPEKSILAVAKSSRGW